MSEQSFRMPAGGLVDRSRRLSFSFDGRMLSGHPGDTLASALLANGVRLVGRSFKYHRPRGIVSAGPEEPNALVQVGPGDAAEPNVQATMLDLADGLVATSQNRWPSLRFDVAAVNDRLSRFLPAGFYYKTFMWPPSAWMAYERPIRRAAGMGKAPRAPDTARYETVHGHCDVLVVGSGPAGLAAALAAGRAGARVMLVEQHAGFGGALRRERHKIDGRPAIEWVAAALAELEALPTVTTHARATAFGYYDHNMIGIVEVVRGSEPSAPRERLHMVRAREVVLATGAIEQLLVFPGNDRPGVMLAGAARAYVNEYGVRPGRVAVVFGAASEAARTARDLSAAGIEVPAVLTGEGQPHPGGVAAEWLAGYTIAGTHGRHSLASVDIACIGEARPERRIACDLLCVAGGWTPAVHLQSQSGARPVYDPAGRIFMPGAPVQRERSAGAARGIGRLADCIADGFAAGAAAAERAGLRPGALPPTPACDGDEAPERLSVLALTPRRGSGGKQLVDLQTDVTADDVRLAHREGYVSVEHLKRYTTLGMGADQGKTGNLAGLTLMAAARGVEPGAVGTTTFRPPFTPVALGTLAGRRAGPRYAHRRFSPLHDSQLAAGGVMGENGLWMRPRAYPRAGETLDAAIAREARTVREAVGITDMSTVGKIEIAGPDALELIERVYANGFRSLPVGRGRYGVMLREDGHVADDGTVCRLGESRYLATTSTGHGEHIVERLEFYLQAVWPDLRAVVTDLTDDTAIIAVAGPRSREALGRVVAGADLSTEALPFLGVADCTIAGIEGRIFRGGFSGELAYEVNVPAPRGGEVWDALLAAGRDLGIIPYGTEAMGVLRIEKGYVASSEIDGRTTPHDLGMGPLLGRKKAYVGRAALARPGLADPRRPALVGIVAVDGQSMLRAGALLTEAPPPPTPAPSPVASIGRVTVAAPSPSLGRWIALALVEGGRERLGETVHAAFPLKDECVAVRIVDPAFVDPDKERLRA